MSFRTSDYQGDYKYLREWTVAVFNNLSSRKQSARSEVTMCICV